MDFSEIKGIGKSRIAKLKAAGINTPLDLLLHFPYKYVDTSSAVDFSKLSEGDDLTVCGTVVNQPEVRYLRKGLRLTKVVLDTKYGQIEANWFNRKYIATALPCGKTVCLNGKVKKFRNKISLSAPVIVQSVQDGIVPLYKSLGIPQTIFNDAIGEVLERAQITGYIPDEVRQKYRLGSLTNAFKGVHRPNNITQAESAAKILALEKLSYTLSAFSLVKTLGGNEKKYEYGLPKESLNNVINSLPFKLTQEQDGALNAILKSLNGEAPMNMLLQGDVGCGKTVIALLCMFYAHLCGYQSVLMAPTEILALQHYKSAIRFLEPLGAKCALLCGSLNKQEREQVLFNIRTKSADIIIGTHALISESVEFKDLSLVITDEQQRFGVNQRGSLENKAQGADTLVMTATPIPRTLALCVYGELCQTNVKSLPQGRPDIVTKTVPASKYKSMFDYVFSCAEKGEQTYIVCPRIDADEDETLISATELHKKLIGEYNCDNIGLLHGRLKDSEKSEVMRRFACGDIKVLVATSVVEVGIDVPSATNIIIFNSERYGLSQLHQLRGRVGRGVKKSYCFLPTDNPVERLNFFCNCRDGFELSEYDFVQRGAGDFIGTRQHGDSTDFPIKIDAELIKLAKLIADDTLRNAEAKAILKNGITCGTEEYIKTITMN